MQTMKLLQATASLVFLLGLACSASDASAVHDVCRSLTAGHHKHVVRYDYCVKFFHADNGSATADHRGLAAIAAKITAATAERTADRIAHHLRSSEKDRRRVACLRACAKAYSEALAGIGKAAKGIASGTNGALGDAATTLAGIGKAAKGIASGTNGALGDAATTLAGVLDAASTCEYGFRKLHRASPVAAEDAKFRKQVAIAVFVTGTL